jgi:hypothetical protein
MEKTTMAAKRTGEFTLVENTKDSVSKKATVLFTINGKAAEMLISETYKSGKNDKGVQMRTWHFVTGDKLIDSTATLMENFKMFEDVLDIIVDINDILFDAENFFAGLKAEEEVKAKAQAEIARAKEYDTSSFLKLLKPILEGRGHTVTATTREEFIANTYREVELLVDGFVLVDHDYHGWVRASNKGTDNSRIEQVTRSIKIEKIVEIVESVIRLQKDQVESKAEAIRKKQSTKEKLEAWLGEAVIQKDAQKGHYVGPRNTNWKSYTETYFVRASDPDGLRFREVNGDYNTEKKGYDKKFDVSNFETSFGSVTDLNKFVNLIDSFKK